VLCWQALVSGFLVSETPAEGLTAQLMMHASRQE